MNRLVLAIVAVSACHRSGPAPTGAGSEGEAAAFVETARDALVGHPAPAVTLQLLDGSKIDLATLLGKKPIYLKFWATWCVPCREEMPHLEATLRDHGDQLAVYAVDVAIDDPIENVREFVARKHLTVPIAIDADGSVAEQFHLNVTPQHVLIDRTGVVRFVGHAVTPELEQAIAMVVGSGAAGAPATPATPAPSALPALALDNKTMFDFATRPKAPLALTFATLFCDSYIAESRPAIGATCAAHAKKLEEVHRAHPELAWITVAFPVWTSGDDIAEYRKRLGATVPIGIDRGNLWFHKFGVRDTFTTVLFDSAGAELGRVGGDGAGLDGLIAKAR
ncbi:MAG: TlpA disulfide reductase family protein [Kofleriaceae bacterium]